VKVRLRRAGDSAGGKAARHVVLEHDLTGIEDTEDPALVDVASGAYTATTTDEEANPTSLFALCISNLAGNRFADVLLRVEIDLNVRDADADEDPRLAVVSTEDDINDAMHRVKSLQREMRHVRRKLVAYQELEERANHLVDETSVNVKFLCFCQTALIVGVGVWQIFHLWRFFREKKLA
jgi:flagellin-like hook-associated protein FlgL